MKRINLLPPEIAARRRARRQGAALVFALLGFVALLVALFVLRQAELNRQRDRLEQAQAEVQALEAERRDLQEFADLETTLRRKEATLATAMAGDIAWSRLLIELSMIIPGDAWLSAFSGAAAPPTETPPAGAPVAAPRLGSLTFTATTFDFPGVARWITRLQEMNSLQNIWVPTATKGTIGTRTVVNFSSTADLSEDSASGRFQTGVTAQ